MSNLLKRLFPSNTMEHNIMVLDPGKIEEALNFMARPGKIDVSGLKFDAAPHQEEEGGETEDDHHPDTLLDIAIFELPSSCSNHNCVLSEAGIGRMEEYDGGRPFMNMCYNGRLFINGAIFKGRHIEIKVPARGAMRKYIKRGKFDVEKGGRYYEVVIANCNKSGRQVDIEGQIIFEFFVDDGPSRLSSIDLPDTHYLMVSISTFIFLVMCCFRVRCSSRNAYEQAAMEEEEVVVDVEMTGGEAA
jgi:hypothetical protein